MEEAKMTKQAKDSINNDAPSEKSNQNKKPAECKEEVVVTKGVKYIRLLDEKGKSYGCLY